MAEDHPTEAACLLEQGATYRRRIGLKPIATPGDPIFAGFKHGAFSLYFGDAPIYHFDLEGRWQRAFVDDTHYLKGLDATVHAIDRVREGPNLVLKRRTLADAESGEIDERVRSTALELIAGLEGGTLGRVEPASTQAQPLDAEALREFLQLITFWDSTAWLAHRKRFDETYGPLPFIPPECQNAVILRASLDHTAGITFGGAPANETFTPRAGTSATLREGEPPCEPSANASSDRASPSRNRRRGSHRATHDQTPAEFAQHVKDVAALWGRRLLQSRILFLTGSDVLHLPVQTIAAQLDAIGRTFPIAPRTRAGTTDRCDAENQPRFDGVHVFLDNFTLPRPDRAGWSELVARGLVRVSLSVESGDPEIRTIHRKSWADDELRATVAACKAAGLGVSVLTLVGAGGIERAEPHVERTVRLIESLEMGPGDFVFLLDEKEIEGPISIDQSVSVLQRRSWSDQQARLKEALAPLKKRGVKALPYTMEKQWT